MALVVHPVLWELLRPPYSAPQGVCFRQLQLRFKSRVYLAVSAILRRSGPCSATVCYGETMVIQSP